MARESWIRIARESEIEEGKLHAFRPEGAAILATKRGGNIYAYGLQCPHQGAPLNEGTLSGEELICPWHNSRFDIANGAILSPPALDDLPTYAVNIEGGNVYVGDLREPSIQMPEGRDDRMFAIVGAGAAGNAAAEHLRRLGYAGRLVLLTADDRRPYDRTMLSKAFMRGDASEADLFLRSGSFYERLNIELRTGCPVAALHPERQTLKLAGGESIKADEILLTTGSRPSKPDIPGLAVQGSFSLRSAQDGAAILAALAKTRRGRSRVVVLGAGFVGMEVAASLVQRDFEVHVAAPEREPMALTFGERIGARIRRLHEQRNVHLHMGCEAREIVRQQKSLSVVLTDRSEIPAEVVIYGLGAEPATGYLRETGLLYQNGVWVDEHLRTRAVHVYAAGDIAFLPFLGRHRGRVEHWAEAESQGRHAALSMMGRDEPYVHVPFFWTRQYETSLKYVGMPGYTEAIAYRGEPENGSFLAGFYAQDRLMGAAAMGRDRELLRAERYLAGNAGIPYHGFGDPSYWE